MTSLADEAVRHYLNLPYRIALTRDGAEDERPWRAAVEELAGCEARGATPTDAAARVPAALAEWVASAQSEGRQVPEPRDGRAYSGKLLLRMPQSLHGELAKAAEDEHVSLNAYITVLLTSALQAKHAEPAGRAHPPPLGEPADVAPETSAESARLQRFLAVALAANVAVVAVAAIIAIVLLISAS